MIFKGQLKDTRVTSSPIPGEVDEVMKPAVPGEAAEVQRSAGGNKDSILSGLLERMESKEACKRLRGFYPNVSLKRMRMFRSQKEASLHPLPS
jgi:hypothetical protein